MIILDWKCQNKTDFNQKEAKERKTPPGLLLFSEVWARLNLPWGMMANSKERVRTRWANTAYCYIEYIRASFHISEKTKINWRAIKLSNCRAGYGVTPVISRSKQWLIHFATKSEYLQNDSIFRPILFKTEFLPNKEWHIHPSTSMVRFNLLPQLLQSCQICLKQKENAAFFGTD